MEINKNKPLIEVKNLSVTYFMGRGNETKALQNVTLKIFPGEFVIFFGPSGCGKSTLLYSISGLETHAQGYINVGGKIIPKMTIKEIAHFRQKTIGMIFQAFYLIGSLSVIKNVMLPQVAISADFTQRVKRAEKLLTHFGVGEQKDKLPTELSGGQQQRVAISRALINDPEIIMADEPVGNLDSKSATDVMNLIDDMNTKQNKTIILVTHDASHLHMAHRVFYMKDGKVIDVKINKAINEEVLKEAPDKERPDISKELELLIRTYSSIQPEHLGNMLIPFKAKQIVSNVFTGMSVEELHEVEKYVEYVLSSKLNATTDLKHFLDRPHAEGGLGLNAKTAEKLANKIDHIAEEISAMSEEEKSMETQISGSKNKEAIQIRKYLLETFDVNLKHHQAFINFENAVEQRLENKINKSQFQTILDNNVDKNGVGLNKTTAKKIAKHYELLMLGKYQL